MVDKLAIRLTDFITDNFDDTLSNDEKSIYVYGLEVIISTVINITVLITIAIIFKNVLAAMIFLFCFSSVRTYCGGYHAKTRIACNACSAITFMSVLFAAQLISKYMNMYIIATVLLVIFLLLYAFPPLLNESKNPKTECELLKFKQTALCILVVIGILSLYTMMFNKFYASTMVLSILAVAILFIIELKKRKKQ